MKLLNDKIRGKNLNLSWQRCYEQVGINAWHSAWGPVWTQVNIQVHDQVQNKVQQQLDTMGKL